MQKNAHVAFALSLFLLSLPSFAAWNKRDRVKVRGDSTNLVDAEVVEVQEDFVKVKHQDGSEERVRISVVDQLNRPAEKLERPDPLERVRGRYRKSAKAQHDERLQEIRQTYRKEKASRKGGGELDLAENKKYRELEEKHQQEERDLEKRHQEELSWIASDEFAKEHKEEIAKESIFVKGEEWDKINRIEETCRQEIRKIHQSKPPYDKQERELLIACEDAHKEMELRRVGNKSQLEVLPPPLLAKITSYLESKDLGEFLSASSPCAGTFNPEQHSNPRQLDLRRIENYDQLKKAITANADFAKLRVVIPDQDFDRLMKDPIARDRIKIAEGSGFVSHLNEFRNLRELWMGDEKQDVVRSLGKALAENKNGNLNALDMVLTTPEVSLSLLGEGLKTNTTLHALSLSTTGGVRERVWSIRGLIEGLRKNKTLRILNTFSLSIGEEDAAEVLKQSTSIEEFKSDVSSVVSPSGVRALAEALKTNNTLKTIGLVVNCGSLEQIMLEGIAKNQSLKNVYIPCQGRYRKEILDSAISRVREMRPGIKIEIIPLATE